MKIKHSDIVIDETDPFKNCKLDRKRYAEVLTDIIKTYEDGFVLAINNEWGAGKTTFVKMWKQMLLNQKIGTIYFNAWENDFEGSSLVAIMSELKTITASVNDDHAFKEVLKKGSVIAKSIIPAVVKAVAKKYTGADDLTADALEKAAEGATEILDQEIQEFANKKKAIVDFRIELENLIQGITGPKPLVFIIDELDRCRPDYSVEVLESLKHLFSVKGIVFVLSIDKKHLASSIKGYYGSVEINTDEYLRRFIDLEYEIPKPSNKAFIKYMFEYYSFANYYLAAERYRFPDFREDANELQTLAETLFNYYPTTLRQQERVFALTRICLKSISSRQYTFSNLLFFLIYLKLFRNHIYTQIYLNHYSIAQLTTDISDILKPTISDAETKGRLIILIALLLHFYNNDQVNHSNLFATDPTAKKFRFIFHLNFDDEERMGEILARIDGTQHFREVRLSSILNRINLFEPIKF